jgi:hypothetical protein
MFYKCLVRDAKAIVLGSKPLVNIYYIEINARITII